MWKDAKKEVPECDATVLIYNHNNSLISLGSFDKGVWSTVFPDWEYPSYFDEELEVHYWMHLTSPPTTEQLAILEDELCTLAEQ
jgi:hypothetical protein